MIALIVYHKNIGQYPPEWIEKFKQSILEQTYQKFDVVECNYGLDDVRIFDRPFDEFHQIRHETFADAMNYLLDRCFYERKDEYVLNTNIDDFYSPDWVEKSIEGMAGNDLISSNFCLVKNDKIVHWHKFHELDIKTELGKFHNPVAHPSVCYSPRFWKSNRYNPEEIPFEDMLLWTRAINNGYKFKILEENLLFHRLHENSVGHKLKEE